MPRLVIDIPVELGETVYKVHDQCHGGSSCPYNGGPGIDRCGEYPVLGKRCGAYYEAVRFSLDMIDTVGKDIFVDEEDAKFKVMEYKHPDQTELVKQIRKLTEENRKLKEKIDILQKEGAIPAIYEGFCDHDDTGYYKCPKCGATIDDRTIVDRNYRCYCGQKLKLR